MKRLSLILAMEALTFGMNAQTTEKETTDGAMITFSTFSLDEDTLNENGYMYNMSYVSKDGLTFGVGTFYANDYEVNGLNLVLGYTPPTGMDYGLQALGTVLIGQELGFQMSFGYKIGSFIPSVNLNSFKGFGVGIAFKD
jgi:hypothetical protein